MAYRAITDIKTIRSRRRTMELHIREDGALIVRAPRFVRDEAIHRFVREKSSWIEKARQRILERAKLAQDLQPLLPEEERGHKERALALLTERCGFFSGMMGVTYTHIGISGARSRWGSCSPRGRLRFNWRLAMAPAHVLDYVVVHELAHLKELNHSRRFWAQVAAILPDFREAKTWLKENAFLLRAYRLIQ